MRMHIQLCTQAIQTRQISTDKWEHCLAVLPAETQSQRLHCVLGMAENRCEEFGSKNEYWEQLPHAFMGIWLPNRIL